MNRFGNRLRSLRENKKLTLRNLAEKSNLSYSFIASLEKGRFNPSRESINALAPPLDADANELLMLAGFLPDEKVFKQADTSLQTDDLCNKKAFPIEEILNKTVTYNGILLNEEDKASMLAFLNTLLDIKNK